MTPKIREWKHVSNGSIVDYTVLKIHERQVASPRDGSLHKRVQIQAPDWVHVIATTHDEQLIFVRQFRCGIWKDTLEVPGGIIDGDESPETAARRELEEETGYRALNLKSLGFSHPNPAIQNNRIFTFAAYHCEKIHAGNQDLVEYIVVELYPRSELPRLIREGQVSHALVLAAFYLESLDA